MNQHPTPNTAVDDLVTGGPLALDVRGSQAWVDDEPVGVTKFEGDVLATLLDLVWGYDGYNPNVIENQVSSLRCRLASAPVLIQTMRGLSGVASTLR